MTTVPPSSIRTPAPSALEELIAPALADYSAELARHGRTDAPGLCRCGWRPAGRTRANLNRSLGMHVAAAERRADRAYDRQVDELIRARRP